MLDVIQDAADRHDSGCIVASLPWDYFRLDREPAKRRIRAREVPITSTRRLPTKHETGLGFQVCHYQLTILSGDPISSIPYCRIRSAHHRAGLSHRRRLQAFARL